MGLEIDLLVKYPRPRVKCAQAKAEEDRQIAGAYHSRFWQPVVSTYCEHFKI